MELHIGDLSDSDIKYDGKNYTWQMVYKKAYKENFIADSKLQWVNKRYQLFTEFKYKVKQSNKIFISGDIIFNFFDDPPKKQGKRRLYTEMMEILKIESENAKNDTNQICRIKEIKTMLEECNKRVETKANVSILPSTGGLQFVKQAIGRDRFDTFVWCIDEHYNNRSVLFNHCAAAYLDDLKSFLNLFEDVYEFCFCIYNLDEDDKELIDLLIKSGCKPIDCSNRILEYVILANKFWHRRIDNFKKIGIDNPHKR